MGKILPLVMGGLLTIICSTATFAQKGLAFDEQVFDFGHVGIDFHVTHTFKYVNSGPDVIKITKLDVPCDCSIVTASDTAVAPGDTIFFRLKFSTRDFYGPTNKSFTVHTDSPDLPELVYFNKATIGQWYHYLKPDPISVFFLPGKTTRQISIPNRAYDRIRLSILEQSDDTFDVQILNSDAQKGKSLDLEIRVRDDLPRGTFLSNVTIKIEKSGDDKPSILTIPVKTVRF